MPSYFPTLENEAASRYLDDLLPVIKQGGYSPDYHFAYEKLKFPSHGYSKLPLSKIEGLREGLLEIATTYQLKDNKKKTAEFDNKATAWLAEQEVLATAEMFNDEVWAAISLSIWADIIYWRFGDETKERYFGGSRRGAIQRLWQRAYALDKGKNAPDRWELVEKLTEDNLVQIMERTSISGSPLLAKAVASILIEVSDKGLPYSREKFFRHLIIAFRLRNLTIDFHFLDEKEIRSEVIKLLPGEISAIL